MPPAGGGPAAPARSNADLAWAALLSVGTVALLLCLPYRLGESDEGLFLYEAVRVLAGDVFYRDVYDIITPGSHYVMAALFGLFGSTMQTAFVATAVLHGMIAGLTYAIARALGVRRSLATVAAALHVALCQSAWPHASPHWFSTLLTMGLFAVLVRRPDASLVQGVFCGAMVLVQQQHAAVTTLGVALWIFADHLVLGRTRGTALPPRLGSRLVRFGAGIALVVLPLGALLTLRSGPMALIKALLLQPLQDYAAFHGRNSFAAQRWGYVGIETGQQAKHTLPVVLRWLPFPLLVDLARVAAAWRRRDAARLRPLVTVVVFGATAVASALYVPDFIHVAFIGAILAVIAAEALNCALTILPGPLDRALGTAGAAAALVTLGMQFQRHLELSWSDASVRRTTAFGVVDFPSGARADLVDDVRRRLDEMGTHTLFAYPAFPALYLLAGARNPTPYQLLILDYSPTRQVTEVIDVLERREVPYVALIMYGLRSDDPMLAYLNARYHPVIVDTRAGVALLGRGAGPGPEPTRAGADTAGTAAWRPRTAAGRARTSWPGRRAPDPASGSGTVAPPPRSGPDAHRARR